MGRLMDSKETCDQAGLLRGPDCPPFSYDNILSIKLLQKKLIRPEGKKKKGGKRGTQRVSLNSRFFGLARLPCPEIWNVYRPLIASLLSRILLSTCSFCTNKSFCLRVPALLLSPPLVPMIVLRRPPIICMRYSVPAHRNRCMR